MKSLPTNPDVIVVGAGISGLSAAKALNEAGLSAIVLEAADQIGGRCITDNSTFSVPFDLGGSWLHAASINPLARLAEQTEFELHKTPWVWSRVHAMGRELTEVEVADYRQYQKEMWRSVKDAGRTQDVAIASVMPKGSWAETASHSVPQMLAADADVTSTMDTFNYADGAGDWLVGGGLGNFMAHLHQDVPVMCNCPVSKIEYIGPRVKVTTPKGTLEAENLVLTVSTGVLGARTIEFQPPLPPGKIQAIDALPNGLLNKIGIEFDPEWQGAVQGQMADYHSSENEFCSLLFGFFGTSLATGFVAGRFADELEKQGPGAATEYCFEGLRALFGSNIQKSIQRTSETAWRSDSYSLGSYSYAAPGKSDARKVLAEPINQKLFFGGEATLPNSFATVHGAFLSGKLVAKQIVESR